MIPSSRREANSTPAKPLDALLRPLLGDAVEAAMQRVCAVFPPARDALRAGSSGVDSEGWVASLTDVLEPAQLAQYLPCDLQAS